MNPKIVLLFIAWIHKASLLELQSSSLGKWVKDQTRFNSFLITEKDLSNTSNSLNSSVVHLKSEFNHKLHRINFKAKCHINDLNSSSIAPRNLCPLQGKLGSYEVISEKKFLYILIDGCYTKDVHLIWVLTNSKDLLDYQNKTSDKKFSFTEQLKFGDGSNNCSNLCEKIICESRLLEENNTQVAVIVGSTSIFVFVVLSGFVVLIFCSKRQSNKISA